MRAVLCTALEGPAGLRMQDIAPPSPREGEITIRVSAAALNFFDTLILRGKYQYQPELPFSPGGEVAGTIDAVGGAVTGFHHGQRVMAYVKWNGCRDIAVARAADTIAIPDDVSDEAAAGVSITYGTAMHGLRDRGQMKPGETVAVLGASGGAGLAAVEIARLMGARVIGVASGEKLEAAVAAGAHDTVDYAVGDLKESLRSLTAGRGVDVVYDCVGGPYAEPAIRAMAWEGRYLTVGYAGGEIPKIPLNVLLLKGCAAIGVFFGKFVEAAPEKHRANMTQVLAWIAAGSLTPRIQAVLPLEETAAAIELLEQRKVTGKIIIRP